MAWLLTLRRLAASERLKSPLLCLLLLLTVLLRLLPLKWGAYLSGPEAYWHLYVARHMVERGFSWAFHPGGWIDGGFWYPQGRDVAATSFLGLPLTLALLRGLGLPLMEASLFLPPSTAVLTVLLVYLLGSRIGRWKTGILAGLLLSLTPSYLSRTSAGYLETYNLGIPLLLAFLLLFLKALEEGRVRLPFYAAASGLAYAYLNLSSNLGYYAGLLLASLTLSLLVLHRASWRRLAPCYFIALILGVVLASPFPVPGLGTLLSAAGLPLLFTGIVLATYIPSSRLFKGEAARLIFGLAAASLGASGFYLSGLAAPLTGEVLEVLNPSVRTATVSGLLKQAFLTYRVGTWASIYMAAGIGLPLGLLGLFFASRGKSPLELLLILYALTSLYASSSMVGLSLLIAPPLSLLSAQALTEILKSAGRMLKSPRPKRATSIAKPALFTPIILAIILSASFLEAVKLADVPPALASSNLPGKTLRPDWLDALSWTRKNLKGEPVVALWSHGYWLGVLGQVKTVADPSLINGGQAAMVGVLLLSGEEKASEILKEHFQARYLLVFIATMKSSQVEGLHMPSGVGDDGGWVWMARAASRLNPEITVEKVDKDGNGLPDEDTLLGKVILYAMGASGEEVFEKFEVAYTSPSHSRIPEIEEAPQIIVLKAK